MLNNEQILTQVENAFVPLRCSAQIWACGLRLRFKVFDGGRDVIDMPKILVSEVQDELDMKSMLAMIRLRLGQKGYLLH